MNPSDLIIPLLLAGAAACGTGRPGQRLRRPNPRRGGRSHRPAPRNPRSGGLTHRRQYVPGLRCHGCAGPAVRPGFEPSGASRAETVPLMLVRPVSGSGALAVASDLMAAHGPDSYIGRVAAVMLGSTETTFYTIAVYFGSAGIVRTRHTVPAALAADLTGFLTAALTVRLLFGP